MKNIFFNIKKYNFMDTLNMEFDQLALEMLRKKVEV